MTVTPAARSTHTARQNIETLARDYIAAWQRGDLDALDSLHADDVRYQLHGFHRALTGRRAVRESFARQFDDAPDAVLSVVDLQFGPAHFVLQSTVTGNSRTRGFISLDAVDVFTVRNGLVASKDAYVTVSKARTDPKAAAASSATETTAKVVRPQLARLAELDSRLDRSRSKPYLRGLSNGTMTTVLYAPQNPDLQTPHEQDEIYFIARGRGTLKAGEQTFDVQPGDAVFVPALMAHCIESHSADFLTWAVLWGPKDGEKN